MLYRNKGLSLFTLIILLSTATVLAQTTTPTAAPSKTPTASPTQQTDEPNPEAVTQPTTAKTQADLSILTGNVQRPNGLLWHNDKIYASCSGDWTLYEIDTTSNTTIQYLYGIRNTHSLYATNEEGETHLWIPDFQSNTFVHIHQGTAQVVASNLQGPWGISQIDQETFAITNLNADNVTAITRNGDITEVITGLRSPAGITSDNENIYIANTGSARRAIEWFPKADLVNQENPINAAETKDQILISGVQNVTSITTAADNYIYFSYALGTRGVVGRINPEVCRNNGGCTAEEIEIVLYTELAAPLAGLTISPDMRLFIHSIYSPDIYWVQLDNTEST